MCGEREPAGRRPARFGERFGERHKARLTHPGRNVENERRKPPCYGIIADAFLRSEVSDTRFQHFAPQGPAIGPRSAMREPRRSQRHRALRESPPLRGFGGGEPSSPGPPLKRKHTPCACLRVRGKTSFSPLSACAEIHPFSLPTTETRAHAPTVGDPAVPGREGRAPWNVRNTHGQR